MKVLAIVAAVIGFTSLTGCVSTSDKNCTSMYTADYDAFQACKASKAKSADASEDNSSAKTH